MFEPYKNEKLDELLKIYDLQKYIKYNQSLARGLDYYNGIIFEVKLKNNSSTIIAGGRYNGVINNELIGFSIGITRLMQFTKLIEEIKWKDEYYLACIGKIDNKHKHKLINHIQSIIKNKKFIYSLEDDKKLNKIITEKVKQYIKYIIIIGENEIKNNIFIIKDLEYGIQKEHIFEF